MNKFACRVGVGIVWGVLAVAWAAAGAGLGAKTAPGAGAWKFVALSDSRADVAYGRPGYAPDNGVNRAALTALLKQIALEKPDFVLFPGDAVMGEKKASAKGGVLKSEMKGWIALMSKLPCPWYFTPGNHEAYQPGNEQELREAYHAANRAMPTNGPADQKELVYSFDHKNAHVVSLNSYTRGASGHVQLDWMKTDLAGSTNPLVFVMAHAPAFTVTGEGCLDAFPAERDAFWAQLTTAHARAYFCGHQHIFDRRQPVPGSDVWQVIIGCSGAPPDEVPGKGKPKSSAYVVVTVDGANVTYTAKDARGNVLDRF